MGKEGAQVGGVGVAGVAGGGRRSLLPGGRILARLGYGMEEGEGRGGGGEGEEVVGAGGLVILCRLTHHEEHQLARK